jgi:hypothetical protein
MFLNLQASARGMPPAETNKDEHKRAWQVTLETAGWR